MQYFLIKKCHVKFKRKGAWVQDLVRVYNFSYKTSLKIPKLSAINTLKSTKLITKESVIKFLNLSQCPCNTQ